MLVEQSRDPARGLYRVRWAVEGRDCRKSCFAKALADAFLGSLKDAARDGTPFDLATGLPARPKRAAPVTATWHEYAQAYAEMGWLSLAVPPGHRRNAHHDHPRPHRTAPQSPQPRGDAPCPVRLRVQRPPGPPGPSEDVTRALQ